MNAIREILSQSFLALLCVGGAAGVVLGAGLLIQPERIAVLNRLCSRWIGTQKLDEELDRPRWIERYVYRHHWTAGALLLVGALFVLYVLLFGSRLYAFAASLSSGFRVLWDSTRALLLLGSVLAALVGAVIMVRPSLLRDIERASNRWVSTDTVSKTFEGIYDSFDRQVLRHSRTAGVLMILGGAYVLMVLGQLLLRGGWRW